MMSKQNSIAQRVLTSIKEDIIGGVIKDGEIITERALEQRYSVSRTPIKEALKVLEVEGWVEITPRQETRIIPFGITELQETLAIRIAMEGIATKLCIQNMTEEIHAEFSQMLHGLEQLGQKIKTRDADTLDVYNTLDKQFHDMIYRHSGNRMLRAFHNRRHSLAVRTYRNIPLDMLRIRNGSDELIQIIQYILCKNTLMAEAHTAKHIINSLDNKIRTLQAEAEKAERGNG